MTCFEVLIRRLRFKDHLLHDKMSLLIDQVINYDLRPEVPEYVEDWASNLLCRCWQCDPKARPSVEEILDLFFTYLASLRRREKFLKEDFGKNFRAKGVNMFNTIFLLSSFYILSSN